LPTPPQRVRRCAECNEPRCMNQLLPYLPEDEGQVGASGDWQGQIWAYCLDCAEAHGMLGDEQVPWAKKEVYFKREQKKRWTKRGLRKANRTSVARASSFKQARERVEARIKGLPPQSRRSQVPAVVLEIQASRIAAEVNSLNPKLRAEAAEAFEEYRKNCEEEEKDLASASTAPTTR
jgi:hypothetical protein